MSIDIFGQRLYRDHAHKQHYSWTTLKFTASAYQEIKNQPPPLLFIDGGALAYSIGFPSAIITGARSSYTVFDGKTRVAVTTENPKFIQIAINGKVCDITAVANVHVTSTDVIKFPIIASQIGTKFGVSIELFLKVPITTDDYDY